MALYAIGKDHGVEKVRGNVNDKMKRKAKKSRTTIGKRKTFPIYSLKKDEQQLILYYRILSDKDKEDILAKITKKVKDNK